MQGHYIEHFSRNLLSVMEAAVGPLPDWRRTAFWRESSFVQAWGRAKGLPAEEVW